MATPSEKLADALEALHELQTNGSVAIRSADLSRTHRERLVQNGFLEVVIKGWYVPARLDETRGESTAWYASFWQFCAAYLNHLKGDVWCLSPEQSIALHTENMGLYIINGGHRHLLNLICEDQFNRGNRCPTQRES